MIAAEYGEDSVSRQDAKSAKKARPDLRLPLGGLCVFARDIILSVIETYIAPSELSGNGFQFLRVSNADKHAGDERRNPNVDSRPRSERLVVGSRRHYNRLGQEIDWKLGWENGPRCDPKACARIRRRTGWTENHFVCVRL